MSSPTAAKERAQRALSGPRIPVPDRATPLGVTTRGARPLSQPLIPPVWVFRAPLDAKGRGALGAPPAVGLAAQPAARAKGPASGPTLPCRRGRGHSVLRTKTSSTQILRSYLQAEARRRGVRRPGRGSWGVRMASWGVGVRMASACGCASVATRGHASDGPHALAVDTRTCTREARGSP